MGEKENKVDFNALPEINVQKTQKKKERRGFLPLASGASGGASGTAQLGGAAAAKSSLITAFLATKAGMAVSALMAAVVFAGVGLGVRQAMINANNPNGAAGAGAASGDLAGAGAASGGAYVPMILRNKDANLASALEMFNQTNRGLVSDVGEGVMPKYDKNKNKGKDAGAEGEEVDPNATAQGAAGDVMAGLMGGAAGQQKQGGLKNALGSAFGGSSPFGNNGVSFKGSFGKQLGSFGPQVGKGDFNKLGGAEANKVKGMRRNMRSAGRNVGSEGNADSSLLAQLKNLAGDIGNANQSANIDSTRSTADSAWEGQTTLDDQAIGTGGTGIGGGGLESGGVATAPSLDNAGGSGGGTGATTVPEHDFDPDDFMPEETWVQQFQQAYNMILVGAILIAIAAVVAKIPVVGTIIAAVLAGIGGLLAGIGTIMGVMAASQAGQIGAAAALGIGGGLVVASAAAAIAGVDLVWVAIIGLVGLVTAVGANAMIDTTPDREELEDSVRMIAPAGPDSIPAHYRIREDRGLGRGWSGGEAALG